MTQYLSNFGQRMNPVEELLDPVNKLRVSTPENLIDTDFEYGLQSSKWETLELSNNVPSFYVSDSDLPIQKVNSVDSLAGSFIISVTTAEPHGLAVGTPIDVRGLTSRTAEGGFLIQSVGSTTTFAYKAKSVQTFTGNLGSIYTAITPGQFYAGSQIPIDLSEGITTDVGTPTSTLTVKTPYTNGYAIDSNFYLVNSIGAKEIVVGATSTNAPDGSPFVDPRDTLEISFSPTQTKTETKNMRSTYYKKIDASNVDTANNRILWSSNNLQTNDCLLYVPSSGDTAIGGLQRFQVYYVVNPNSTGFQLATSFNGSAIDLTGTGTYAYGMGGFHLCYEIGYAEKQQFDYLTRYYPSNYWFGSGSGWDLRNSTYNFNTNNNGNNFGLGKTAPKKMMVFSPTGTSMSSNINRGIYSTQWGSQYAFNEQSTTPGVANWIEDFKKYDDYQFRAQDGTWQKLWNYDYNGYFNSYYDTWEYSVQASQSFSRGQMFIMIMVEDDEKDSFYYQSHGLLDGSSITLTTTGTKIKYAGSTSNWWQDTTPAQDLNDGTYTVEVISADRFRFTGYRITQAAGTYTLVGNKINPTANSVYSANHGYSGTEEVAIQTSGGGALPAVNTGALNLNTRLSGGNLKTLWSIYDGYMDTYLDGLGADTQDLIMNGYGETSSVPFTSGVSSGGSVINYFSINGWYIYEQALGGFGGGSDNQFDDTKAYELATNSPITGQGYTRIGTKYVNNGSTNHWSYMYGGNGSTTEHEVRTYWYTQWNNGNQKGNSYNNTYTAGGSSDWHASYMYHYETSGSNAGCVAIETTIWKDSWNPNYSGYSDSYWQDTNFWYSYGYLKKQVKIMTVFMLAPGASYSSTNVSNFVSGLVTEIAENFQYPTLTDGQTVGINVINADRFSIKTQNRVFDYNFTSSGTPTLSFKQRGVVGAIDGAYSLDTKVDNKTFEMDAPFSVPADELLFNSANVTNNLVKITGGHFFAPGARVVYKNNGNTSMTGLTNNSTYYLVVQDDDWVGFATTYQQAVDKNTIAISAGSGNHKVSFSLVNGRGPGQGTLTTVAGSKKLVGSATSLFKRYFKVGDTVGIKIPAAVPGDPAEIATYTIAAIADDNNMTVSTPLSFGATDTEYYFNTKLYVRPDGYSVHRPFDGGVEIGAGTAPNSQVVRQTRKYFRYQSGKGIQTSLAINFNPPVQFESLQYSNLYASNEAIGVTKYPHRLTVNQSIVVSGATEAVYNGNKLVSRVLDDTTFAYTLNSTPQSTIPAGIIQFNLNGYSGAYTRAGMFDFQNGFFFEFDGSTLYACRRSSTQQLSGTVEVFQNSNYVRGTSTNFVGQINAGDKVVIRGSTYKVVEVTNRTEMIVQPQYKGISSTNVIVTKTIDTKVPQSNWSIDPCDGTGPFGYVLDKNKIQMAYMDYSWYGAGKLRFGFKDTDGHIKYVHEFIHNNQLNEAYMRSGNLPARYEIENSETPSYTPTLFHWGTSVIMDGRFDDDKAYLFTASSKSLSFTNGQSNTANTNGNSYIDIRWNQSQRTYDWYVVLPFASSNADKFSSGTPLYTADGQLNGKEVAFTEYSGSNILIYLYIQSGYSYPNVYPYISSGTTVNIGSSSTVASTVKLGTDKIPLITVRLAPSVDSGLTGDLGAREIINRMQLKLEEVGLILTHDCDVSLILNGDLSTVDWVNVKSPSLSQLLKHESGDRVLGGTELFSFRASGGSLGANGKRLSGTSNFSLTGITDMGNSILGGSGIFPNGPDILTVAVKVVDTQGINAASPFVASSRVTWTESQA